MILSLQDNEALSGLVQVNSCGPEGSGRGSPRTSRAQLVNCLPTMSGTCPPVWTALNTSGLFTLKVDRTSSLSFVIPMPESSFVMVQVSVGGSRQRQSAEADVVQLIVIQQHALVHTRAWKYSPEWSSRPGRTQLARGSHFPSSWHLCPRWPHSGADRDPNRSHRTCRKSWPR